MRFQRVLLLAPFALACAGCGNLLGAPTADPTPSGTPCPAALIEGRLVAHEQWGVALEEGVSGTLLEVIWPDGHSVVSDAGRIALIDEDGEVVAHVGDTVQIGGGQVGQGRRKGAWWNCGGHVTVVDPG